MFSLFNGRKLYYASRTKNDDVNATPNKGIKDSGIVVDDPLFSVSPYQQQQQVDDDPAPSELSSSAYDPPTTPSNDEYPHSEQQQQQHQKQQEVSFGETNPPMLNNQRTSKSSVHAISYVTQDQAHGYTAGYEDDLSTLGDESIIRRGRQNRQKQQQLAVQYQKSKSFDKTRISKAHTKSTEEMSPQSNDLSFSFSNVLDVNEKIPDSSRMGYDVTDYSMTDKGQQSTIPGQDDDDAKSFEDTFLERNKWTIIKFMVVISLFLLMAAAAVLVVSLLHMRSIEEQTEAWTMENGSYQTIVDDDDDNAGSQFITGGSFTFPPIPAPVPLPIQVEDSNDSTTEAPSASPQANPTSEPTKSSSTLVPSEIVNTATAAEISKVGTDLKFVIANFSPSSLNALDDPTSAQSLAFDWMTQDPNYWTMEISTIVQRWTLAVLYYSTGGPNWREFPQTFAQDKTPWLSYSDECLWESTNQETQGFICDSNGNYFGIHLRGVGLVGTLPSELGLLSNHMRHLFVNGNALTGTLPKELGRLTALEKLNLQYNNFSGSLPSEIGNWGALTIASLGNNRFSGQIPASTGSWGSMQTVSLENNQFVGTLPPEWANMPYVESIQVQQNLLSGTIPEDWNFMYQLQSLSLQSNNLRGQMQWGLCPGANSVQELKADCRELRCQCCTECFVDGKN